MKPLMTWNAKSARWFKKYKHKQYAVSCKELGCSPTRKGSLASANQWWTQKRALLDLERQQAAPPTYRQAVEARVKMRDWYASHGDDEQAARLQLDIDRLTEQGNEDQPPELPRTERDPLAGATPEGRTVWQERFRLMGQEQPPPATLGEKVRDFLAVKETEISAGRYDALARALRHFVGYHGAARPLDSITGAVLLAYKMRLVDEIKAGKLSPATGRDYMGAVKQIVRHYWILEEIDLPRIVESDRLNIDVSAPRIKTILPELFREILGAAVPRAQLWLLLMANCGYQQTDISRLRREEVDLKRGTITRKRSKTSAYEDVPEVTYALWDETLTLLRQFMATEGERALRNRDGGELVRCVVKNGKKMKTDNIRTGYLRLAAKLKRKLPALKLIRKTSASLLETHSEYGRYAPYFLGHSPRGIAAKHYIDPSGERFRAALLWLREQYGLGRNHADSCSTPA